MQSSEHERPQTHMGMQAPRPRDMTVMGSGRAALKEVVARLGKVREASPARGDGHGMKDREEEGVAMMRKVRE